MEMRSNLRNRKNVVTGMGSGYEENQRIAGASNPSDAAKLAGNKITQEEIEDRDAKIKEIEDGFKLGFPKKEITDSNLKDLHEEYIKWRDEKIDKEIEEEYYT